MHVSGSARSACCTAIDPDASRSVAAEPVGVDIHREHRRALVAEAQGHRPADARAGAGHQRDLPVEAAFPVIASPCSIDRTGAASREDAPAGRRGTRWTCKRVADKLEIHELLARYARGVDEHDWDLYRSVFTDDAHIDYSSAGFVGRTAGRGRRVPGAGLRHDPLEPALHHQRRGQLAGDEPHVRAMFYNPMQLPGMDGPSQCGGYYHHDLVRTPDGWRSRRLVEENRWFLNPPG